MTDERLLVMVQQLRQERYTGRLVLSFYEGALQGKIEKRVNEMITQKESHGR